MDDVLDDVLGGSDEEEEQDAIINQVLDEIGIEVAGKVGRDGLTVLEPEGRLTLPPYTELMPFWFQTHSILTTH